MSGLLHQVAVALGGCVTGQHISCPGPGHSQQDKSLSVKLSPEAPDGFVVNSFAGDDFKKCKEHVKAKLTAAGITLPNTAEYVYCDPDGNPSRKVIRGKDKKFTQYHWTGFGWKPGVQGVPLYPYKLPELITSKEVVFVSEGEKDADRVASLGLTATTNPGGAGNWKPDFNKWFEQRDVFLLEDNDQAGRDRCRSIAKELNGIAASIRIVTFENMAPKSDVSDWLDVDPTRDAAALLSYADKFPLWSAQEDASKVTSCELELIAPFGSIPNVVGSASDILAKAEVSCVHYPDVNDKGRPLASVQNTRCLLKILGFRPYIDQFSSEYKIALSDGRHFILDDSFLRLLHELAERSGYRIGLDNLNNHVLGIADGNPVHPVRDYLKSVQCSWDGVARADRLFVDYLGCDDDEYARKACLSVLVAAVWRIYQPGLPYKYMPVLIGPQNIGKSTFVKTLCPSEALFTDNYQLGLGAKETLERTGGKWLVEIGEMAKRSAADLETIKSEISRDTDKARMAYARHPTERKRQFVFIGTTNDEAFLNDPTGAVRFWPIHVKKQVDCKKLAAERDQIWGEVAHTVLQDMEAGDLSHLYPTIDQSFVAKAESATDDAYDGGPLYDHLLPLLGKEVMSTYLTLNKLSGVFFPSAELRGEIKYEFEKCAPDQLAKSTSRAMTKLGWTKTNRRKSDGTKVRGFMFGELPEGKVPLEAILTDVKGAAPPHLGTASKPNSWQNFLADKL